MKRIILSALALVTIAGAALAAETSAPLQREDVTFATSDGVTVSAFFVRGRTEKAPVVILLHMLGGSKEDWVPILEKYLVPETPYAWLALDLRGHGGSTTRNGKTISYGDFTPGDWNAAVGDVAAAKQYLSTRSDVDMDHLAIMGASIGANIALRYAATDPSVKALVLLSPGTSYRGVATSDAMVAYGNRPVLLAAAEEDGAAIEAARTLPKSARGQMLVKVFPGNIHGTRMFGVYPVAGQIADFLAEYMK